MKKILSIVSIMFLSLFLVTGCSVDTSKYFEDYKTLDLDGALTEENITHDLSSYKDDDKKINIYLFRGKRCPHCEEFLTFINSIVPEYGKYFNLVSYEVWYNLDNSNLLDSVSTFLGEPASGVPFIVIGDKVFSGYGASYDESIKTAITDLYNSDNRYDVFEKLEMSIIRKKIQNFVDNTAKVLAYVSIIGLIVVITIVCKKNKKMTIKIDTMQKEINELKTNLTKDETPLKIKEEKKVIKKETKPKTKKETTKTTKK